MDIAYARFITGSKVELTYKEPLLPEPLICCGQTMIFDSADDNEEWMECTSCGCTVDYEGIVHQTVDDLDALLNEIRRLHSIINSTRSVTTEEVAQIIYTATPAYADTGWEALSPRAKHTYYMEAEAVRKAFLRY